MLDSKTQANIASWPNREELTNLSEQELLNAFYKHLEFGTGGLRGKMGAGTNRVNLITIRKATQGLANYIASQKSNAPVIIGYDCRNKSYEFAHAAAEVLAANKIKVYIYKDLRPVPIVSFGVLHKKCIAGIMITASHNPPEYNGYKVYWEYGGQVLPPHDRGIIDEVNRVTQINHETFDPTLIEEIGEQVDEAYLKAIHKLQLHPGDNQTHGGELNIVYTSLFGAGITIVPKALASWGFSNLTLVEEQATPNGDFPNLASPNPEEQAALQLGIETLQKTHGDILIGTDPDTDRIGVVCMHNHKPYLFNGNEIACMATEHVCRSLKASHQMPAKAMFVKTIVTSELVKTIASHYNAECIDVLTGFKYIGEKIAQWAEDGQHHFLFGGEESYGYLLGTHARDKDAVVSSTLIAEMALQMKRQNKTLLDLLYEIYEQYGVYREKLLSLTFEGKLGADQITSMMCTLRENPPKSIAGIEVTTMEDYSTHTCYHLSSGKKSTIMLPKSNVVRLWLEDETKIVVRPSGTEPKIKLYCGVHDKHDARLEENIRRCDEKIDTALLAIKKLLNN